MKSLRDPKMIVGLMIGTVAIAAGAFISPVNHYLLSVLLVLCAVFLYFYTAIAVADRNWWDIRAVFSAIWVVTIGLAALRLTDYQRQWEAATWLVLAAAYAAFYLGATLGLQGGKKLHSWCKAKRGTHLGKVTLKLQPQRLFWICFTVTLAGIALFLVNVKIKGYVPYFATTADAYHKFYTKLYPLAVATTMISGLSYYTLVTQKLSWWKKIFLCLSILYATFLFPMLVVSRGTFLTSALALTTAVFYLHKKRFITLVLSAIVIVVFYMEGTEARGYSDAQLNAFFEPSQIVIAGDETEPMETDPLETGSSETEPDGTDPTETEPGEVNTGTQFQLSGTAAFAYSYLTVSHDNFNEAVRLTENYTWGARQLAPFNVILRIDAIDEAKAAGEYHLVRRHLNTVNLAGEAYYDFGAVGVAVLMLIWAFAFGTIQSFYQEGKGPFALMVLGNTMTPVTLCFFSSWMSIFSHWMHWGFAFILFLAACVSKYESESETENA